MISMFQSWCEEPAEVLDLCLLHQSTRQHLWLFNGCVGHGDARSITMLRLRDAQVARRDGNCQEFLLVQLYSIHGYVVKDIPLLLIPSNCPISLTSKMIFLLARWDMFVFSYFISTMVFQGFSFFPLLTRGSVNLGQHWPQWPCMFGDLQCVCSGIFLSIWETPCFPTFLVLREVSEGHLNRTSFQMLPSPKRTARTW